MKAPAWKVRLRLPRPSMWWITGARCTCLNTTLACSARRIVPTRVSNASDNANYPKGSGQLVSYKVSITNTTDRPLLFGVGLGHRPRR